MKERIEFKAISRNLFYILTVASSLSVVLAIIFGIRIVLLNYQIEKLNRPDPTTTTNTIETTPNQKPSQTETRVVSPPDSSFSISIPKSWNEIKKDDKHLLYQDDANLIFSIDKVDVPSVTTLKQYLETTDEQNKTGYEGRPSKIVIKTAPAILGKYEALQRSETWTAAGFTALVTYANVENSIYIFSIYPNPSTESTNLYHSSLETFQVK